MLMRMQKLTCRCTTRRRTQSQGANEMQPERQPHPQAQRAEQLRLVQPRGARERGQALTSLGDSNARPSRRSEPFGLHQLRQPRAPRPHPSLVPHLRREQLLQTEERAQLQSLGTMRLSQ